MEVEKRGKEKETDKKNTYDNANRLKCRIFIS